MNAPHVDQFYTSGCVGFSGTNMLNTTAAVRSRTVFNRKVPYGRAGISYLGHDDGIRNYHEATVRDPFPGQYPPDDDGSSAIGLMKWWKDAGVISGYDWTFTFDAFLTALQHQPVLVGTNWFDDMMSTEADGVVRSSATGGEGGHEYLATETIQPGTRIYGRTWRVLTLGYEQSWGANPPGFGVQGRFFMEAPLAEELIIHQQGDVAVPRFL